MKKAILSKSNQTQSDESIEFNGFTFNAEATYVAFQALNSEEYGIEDDEGQFCFLKDMSNEQYDSLNIIVPSS